MTCSGPVFCRDRNGVCCLLLYDDRRVLVCPDTCVEPTAASRLQSFAYKLLNTYGNLTDYQDITDTDESKGNLNYIDNDPYNTNFETDPYNDYYKTDANLKKAYEPEEEDNNYNDNDPYNTKFETDPQPYNDYYKTDAYLKKVYEESIEPEEEDNIGKNDDDDYDSYYYDYEYPQSEVDYPNDYEKYYHTDSYYPDKQNQNPQSVSKQPSVWDFLGKLFKHKRQICIVQNNVTLN